MIRLKLKKLLEISLNVVPMLELFVAFIRFHEELFPFKNLNLCEKWRRSMENRKLCTPPFFLFDTSND